MKLEILGAAEVLQDLRIPPGNRLEKLTGDRAGQYSIHIKNNGAFVSLGTKKTPMMWKFQIITNSDIGISLRSCVKITSAL
jgi:RelE-like toxin of type II toxin-antitoxin system HigB